MRELDWYVKKADVLDEVVECETREELLTLTLFMVKEANEFFDEDYMTAAVATDHRLAGVVAVIPPPIEPPREPAKRAVVTRGGRRYKLLSKEVNWTEIPQVHAVVAILGAHMEVGDELDESAIIDMMIANEAVLKTRQGGKRIWDYYKGEHPLGLAAHGNVERI